MNARNQMDEWINLSLADYYRVIVMSVIMMPVMTRPVPMYPYDTGI